MISKYLQQRVIRQTNQIANHRMFHYCFTDQGEGKQIEETDRLPLIL